MKKIMAMLLILVSIFASGGALARMPAVGDHVKILTSVGDSNIEYEGNITEISDSLLCLKANYAKQDVGKFGNFIWGSTIDGTNSREVCIGTGSIGMLIWIE